MDFRRPESAGSDFTLLSAWGSAVAAVVQAAGPTLAGATGYPTAIAVAAVMIAFAGPPPHPLEARSTMNWTALSGDPAETGRSELPTRGMSWPRGDAS
ncbi:hypothetical protein SAMN04490356_0293 [Streptomyces melanosporofaciens]|uniref:Uncharacterized protein n=1 Tax=Streptomyces melanosporofaciens TaxID=67327 RepID=A0A1H4I9Y0_STRMJ|nr:hypothetical protein SAMN04490356_0293 [Streptomyces melanosporofaciens]